MSRNFIELNGRRYDALSGKLLSDVLPSKAPKQPAHKQGNNIAHTRTIDGVLSKPQHTAPASLRKTVTHTSTHKPQPKSGHHVVVSRQPRHVRAHQPQHAQTLMRRAVHKPAPHALKSTTPKAHAPISHTLQKTTATLPVKKSDVDHSRLERAQHIPQHAMVNRFHTPQPVIAKRVEHVPLHIAPSPTPPAPVHQTHAPVSEDPFEHAITHASSHKNLPHSPKKRRNTNINLSNRFIGFATAVGATVALVAFTAYLNYDQISVALAGSRAGFAATTPRYQPAGFSFDSHVESKPGQVTMSFYSRTDERKFNIVQQTSNWNSQTLQDFLASSGKPFKTLSDSGQKIYVLNNAATWVNGGILYRLQGNADLSSRQMIDIAKSM